MNQNTRLQFYEIKKQDDPLKKSIVVRIYQIIKVKNIKLNFKLLLMMHARIFISIVLVQFNITFVKTRNFELSYFQMKLMRASQRREKQNLCRLVRFLQGARFGIEFICSTQNGKV